MRLSRTFSVAAFLMLMCALLPGAAQATSQTVVIQSFAFAPQTVNINTGESITWTNKDPVDHTATANNGAFDKPVRAGTSVTVAFSVVGTYAYHCSIHPSMTGTIVVGTTATPPPPTPPPTPTPRPTPPPTAPPTVPPTTPPTVPPTPEPSPSPSPSASASPTPVSTAAPSASGSPIAVPTSVALVSPSPSAGPGPDLGGGPGPVLATGALVLALALGGSALYLYRRR